MYGGNVGNKSVSDNGNVQCGARKVMEKRDDEKREMFEKLKEWKCMGARKGKYKEY